LAESLYIADEGFFSIQSITRSPSFYIFVFYLLETILVLIIIQLKYDIQDFSLFHVFVISFDAIIITYSIYTGGGATSDLYLLYLLPLVSSAHFLSRYKAVSASFVIVALYGTGLFKSNDLNAINFTELSLQWITRSIFLLICAGLYRLQRSLPPANHTEVISPAKARKRLENLLNSLRKVINYDSVSIQIFYRKRLQIVACIGFPDPDKVIRIDFPAFDERYPNHKVVVTGRWAIENAKQYPSFGEVLYYASNIETWMGIPLISPTTGELFGVLSVDSHKKNAYTPNDAKHAERFAREASAFLIEAALGPAALTLSSKRETLPTALKAWHKELLSTLGWEEEIEMAKKFVQLGREILFAEDCSIFFLRPKYTKRQSMAEPINVLHLVASTSIPETDFELHESIVTDQPKGSLTGYAVYADKTLNYGNQEIMRSPYRSGDYSGHLKYLASKSSRQIMVVPLRGNNGGPFGAIKVENKLGWPSDTPFTKNEEILFEIFAFNVSALVERIRINNYVDRLRGKIHDIQGMYTLGVIQPFQNLKDTYSGEVGSGNIRRIEDAVTHVKDSFEDFLIDSGEILILENKGIIPALRYYLSLYSRSHGQDSNVVNKIEFGRNTARDILPNYVRTKMYNIGREALLNIIRHSKIDEKGGNALISFTKKGNVYRLMVEDSGVGFAKEECKEASWCFGLGYMEEQADKLKMLGRSSFSIKSVRNKGTIIKVIWEQSRGKEKK